MREQRQTPYIIEALRPEDQFNVVYWALVKHAKEQLRNSELKFTISRNGEECEAKILVTHTNKNKNPGPSPKTTYVYFLKHKPYHLKNHFQLSSGVGTKEEYLSYVKTDAEVIIKEINKHVLGKIYSPHIRAA